MSQPSDHERHAAFLRHYAGSEEALHTFVRSLVPIRQMASEVMQDVVVLLWEKFEGAGDFQAWDFGVAKNVVMRHLRSRSRDRHVFDDALVNQLADESVVSIPVHDLIQRHMAGILDDDEAAALPDGLKTQPELRRLFLHYMNLDVALEARASSAETTRNLLLAAPLTCRVSQFTHSNPSPSQIYQARSHDSINPTLPPLDHTVCPAAPRCFCAAGNDRSRAGQTQRRLHHGRRCGLG